MFKPSNMLMKALNQPERSRSSIVSALMGYIDVDPRFRSGDFDSALKYVFSQGVSEDELYVPFDPDLEFVDLKEKWDEKYYALARVYLKDNFCKKRISHVKEIVKALYPESAEEKAKRIKKENSNNPGGVQSDGKKTIDQQSSKGINKGGLIGGILILAVLLVMIMILILR